MRRVSVLGLALFMLLAARCGDDSEHRGANRPRRSQAPDTRPCTVTGAVRRGSEGTRARVTVRRLRDYGEIVDLYAEHDADDAAVPWGSVVAKTEAAADGTFELRSLTPGLYLVAAADGRGAMAAALVTLELPGIVGEVAITLPEGKNALRGRLLDSAGEPLRGTVFLRVPGPYMAGEYAWAVAWTDTDEQGRFEMQGLPDGEFELGLHQEGLLRLSGVRVSLPAHSEVLHQLPKGTETHGRAVGAEDHSALAGAQVLARGEGESGASYFVRMDADEQGRFRAPVPGVLRTLTCKAQGRPTLAVEPSGGGPFELVVEAGASISGTLRAGDGGPPPAGVRCHCLRSTGETWASRRFSHVRTARTTEGGRFLFDALPPGEYVIYAEGNGWISRDARGHALDGQHPLLVAVQTGESRTLDVRVEWGLAATGIVLGPGGAPLDGALVVAMAYSTRPFGSYAAAATAADGSFALDSLVPNMMYVVRTRAAGLLQPDAVPLQTAPDKPLRLHVEMIEPRWITIRVIDEDSNRGVPGAWVVLGEREGEEFRHSSLRSNMEVTDTNGVARIGPLARAEWGACLQLDGYAGDYRAFRPVPGADGEALELALTFRVRRGLSIAGTVLYAGGEPAAGLGVHAASVEGESLGSATTAEDGSFRIWGLLPGSYRLRAAIPYGEHDAEATAQAGQEERVELRLPTPAAAGPYELLVRVLGPDGTPVPRAQVAFGGPGGGITQAYDGEARISYGQEQSWIEVYAARSSDGAPLPYGAVRVERESRGDREITIRMPAEKRISGRATDAAGAPIEGVRVRADPTAGVGVKTWLPHGDALTDAAGAFSIGGLWDGVYRLTFTAPGRFLPAESGAVRTGQADVRAKLQSASTVHLRVLDAAGKPLSGAMVHVFTLDESNAELVVAAETNSEGRVVLRGLDPKQGYSLRASPPFARTPQPSSVWEPWLPADGELRLPARK